MCLPKPTILCVIRLSEICFKNAVEAAPEHSTVMVTLIDGKILAIHNQGRFGIELRANFFDKYATAGESLGGTGARYLLVTPLGQSSR